MYFPSCMHFSRILSFQDSTAKIWIKKIFLLQNNWSMCDKFLSHLKLFIRFDWCFKCSALYSQFQEFSAIASLREKKIREHRFSKIMLRLYKKILYNFNVKIVLCVCFKIFFQITFKNILNELKNLWQNWCASKMYIILIF